MIKWNRNIFGWAQGEDPSATADVDCTQTQLLLTAAFDGESDEATLAAAQRHLLSCTHCAYRWEEWEKTRILLRSVPVPNPPSPLLAQVLLSCRLSPTTELHSLESELAPVQKEELYSPLVAYLEARDEEHADAPLARFIQSPPVPPHLHSQILESTLHAQTPQRPALWPVMREAFRGWSAWVSAPRAAGWGVGVAVPALAAWLIFVGQAEAPIAPNATFSPRSAVAPRVLAKNGASGSEKTTSRIAQMLPATPKAASIQESPGVETKGSGTAALQVVAEREPEINIAETSMQAKTNSVRANSFMVSAKKQVAIAHRTVVSAKKRALPLVDMVENARPRLVNASLKSNAGRPRLAVIRQSPGRRHQISDPKDAPEIQPAELDFDEAFIVVTSQRDDRPEDLGRAFDEYRVSILAENLADEDDLDDL